MNSAKVIKQINIALSCAIGTLYPTLSLANLQFKITDLGTLGGASSQAYAINDLGEIVGSATTADGNTRAVLWKGGAITNLGTLDGASYAYDINNSGIIVGSAQKFTTWETYSSYFYHPVLWNSAGINDVVGPGNGSLDPYRGNAYGINNNGLFVGNSFQSAVIWDFSSYTNLGTMGASLAIATDINDEGISVGYLFGTNGNRGFIGNQNSIVIVNGYAFGINNLNEVVGSSNGQPYKWKSGSAEVLLPSGYIGGEASKINDSGQIVGHLLGANGYEATLWQNGTSVTLDLLIANEPGWKLEYATDINESGQIVGYGYSPNGEYHGFLLTPVAANIPEPSVLQYIGITLLVFGLARKLAFCRVFNSTANAA